MVRQRARPSADRHRHCEATTLDTVAMQPHMVSVADHIADVVDVASRV